MRLLSLAFHGSGIRNRVTENDESAAPGRQIAVYTSARCEMQFCHETVIARGCFERRRDIAGRIELECVQGVSAARRNDMRRSLSNLIDVSLFSLKRSHRADNEADPPRSLLPPLEIEYLSREKHAIMLRATRRAKACVFSEKN